MRSEWHWHIFDRTTPFFCYVDHFNTLNYNNKQIIFWYRNAHLYDICFRIFQMLQCISFINKKQSKIKQNKTMTNCCCSVQKHKPDTLNVNHAFKYLLILHITYYIYFILKTRWKCMWAQNISNKEKKKWKFVRLFALSLSDIFYYLFFLVFFCVCILFTRRFDAPLAHAMAFCKRIRTDERENLYMGEKSAKCLTMNPFLSHLLFWTLNIAQQCTLYTEHWTYR